MALVQATGDLLEFGAEDAPDQFSNNVVASTFPSSSSAVGEVPLSATDFSASLPRPSVGRKPSASVGTSAGTDDVVEESNSPSQAADLLNFLSINQGHDSGHGSGGYESPGSGGNYDSGHGSGGNYDSGHGSGGYDSGGYDSGGYDSGGGWNSDDSMPSEPARPRPRTSYGSILPLERMFNGWQVVSKNVVTGARLVAGKAAEAYNNKSFTEFRNATASTISTTASNLAGLAASIGTPQVLSEGWQLTKGGASVAAGTTVRVAEEAWKATKPVMLKTTNILKKGFLPDESQRKEKAPLHSQVHSGPGRFDTSPLSLSPCGSPPCGSPESSSYCSPVQSPPLSPRQEERDSFSQMGAFSATAAVPVPAQRTHEPPDLMNA